MNRRIITTNLLPIALLLSTTSILIIKADLINKRVETNMDKAKGHFKQAGNDIKDAAHNTKEGLKNVGSAVLETAQETAKKAKENSLKLKEKTQEKADALTDTALAVKDTTTDLAAKAGQKIANTGEEIKEKVIETKDQTSNFIGRIAQKTKNKFNDLFKEVDPVENPASVAAIEYHLIITKPDHSLATPINNEHAQAMLDHIIAGQEFQKRVESNGIRNFDYNLRADIAEELVKVIHNPHAQITITIHREGILSKLT